MNDSVDSPCRAICQLDDNDEFCIGCFRTAEEITNWTHYNDDQKRAIIADLETRRQVYENKS